MYTNVQYIAIIEHIAFLPCIEPRCDRIDILTVALTVIAVVVFVIVLIALAAYVLNWRNKHKRREARMQPM